jgi:hypothetical protein
MSRVRVKMQCKLCEAKFTLMGRRVKEKIETGFNKCTCGNANENEFIIETEDMKPRRSEVFALDLTNTEGNVDYE